MQMLKSAVKFLKEKDKFLDDWVARGHDSCHAHAQHDVLLQKCKNDCKEMEDSDFAKRCREESGLFKCCIR